MKKHTQYIGFYLIILGSLVLMSTRLHALSCYNSLLLTGLLLIVVGSVVHIHFIKHDSKY